MNKFGGLVPNVFISSLLISRKLRKRFEAFRLGAVRIYAYNGAYLQ